MSHYGKKICICLIICYKERKLLCVSWMFPEPWFLLIQEGTCPQLSIVPLKDMLKFVFGLGSYGSEALLHVSPCKPGQDS